MIDPKFVIHTDEINKEILHFVHSKKRVADMLRKLEIAGLLSYKIAGKRRLRSWDVLQGCCYQV
jgi:hypothetical protein